MPEAIIRIIDGSEEPTPVAWDIVWSLDMDGGSYGAGDFAVADSDEEGNRGGFRAKEPLGSAILMCLFSDKRRSDDIPSPDGSVDRRGWHGDTFDLRSEEGERELGSLLWTLERATLNYDTERIAEHYAAEALQTLVDQGVVSRFDIAASVDHPRNRLTLEIRAFDPIGSQVFADTFPLF